MSDIKVFISLPMNKRTEEQILNRMNDVFKKLEESYPNLSFSLIDNYHKAIPNEIKGTRKERPWMLAHSLKLMATADIVILADGWTEAEGCIIEDDVCFKYGIPHILEVQIGVMKEEYLLDYINGK